MKAYLQSFNLLTDKEIDSLLKLAKTRSLKKNEFLIKEGQVCREGVFVVSGCFRTFYYSSLQEEVTYCFTFQNTFLSAYSSFITGLPTQENIQAMANAELLVISKQAFKELEASNVNFLKLSKMIAEQEYVGMEKRIFMLQKEPAEKRYQDLLEKHPEYLQSIPLSYLASYLGITKRHLSRIRLAMVKGTNVLSK